MFTKRNSGILMHITSLPSKYGIGTLGQEAYKFVDFLEKSHISIWQILPLNLTSYGDSPYQSPSNYGYSFYLIDLDILISNGLLTQKDVDSVLLFNDEKRVDYSLMFYNKIPLLKKAFKNFKKNEDFELFLKNNVNARDFSVFMTLKELNGYLPWNKWGKKYSVYTKSLEEEIIKKHSDIYEFYMWTQFEFLNEYYALKHYANQKNVLIMGDLPIYLSYDSVECYKYPAMFQFDEKHNPTRVAGCPPDCFSEDGQLWGNPLYNWEYHKATNYRWWNERIKSALEMFDLLRIDHFRGFSGYFSIPFGDKTARNGVWVKGPGFDLFKDKLGLPIVAEDLGYMDDDFADLMQKTKFPGMKIVIQGMLAQNENDTWLPFNYTDQFFSYSSTHDSETVGQFIDNLNDNDLNLYKYNLQRECQKLNVDIDDDLTRDEMIDKTIEINLASSSIVAVTPIQDLFRIGKEGRMNFPSTLSTDNWSFRLTKKQFDDENEQIAKRLSDLIGKYNRIN